MLLIGIEDDGCVTGLHPHHQTNPASLAYVEAHGRITRREVVALCDMAEKQAEYQLKKLVNAGQLQVIGRGRNAHYELAR